MTYAVSPQFTDSKLTSGLLADAIDVFEDQVAGWLLRPARHLYEDPHAGFAILSLALTYFEPLGQSLAGQIGRSQEQFTLGLKDVFPSLSPIPPTAVFEELYNQLRCGMFHRGITKGKVQVTRGTSTPIIVVYAETGEVKSITVDPWVLLNEIEAHHSHYIARLRDPMETALRTRFHTWFSTRAT